MNKETEEKKKSRFPFFKKKESKGVTKEEAELEANAPRDLKFFFKLFGRRFSKLLTLNFLMLFQIIPLLAAFYGYLQGPTTPVQTSVFSQTVFGVRLFSDAPALTLLDGLSGATIGMPAHGSPVYVIIAVLILLLAVTWGWQNVGATYILRGFVRGEPVFMWTDYKYAIRKNRKQGFFMGLIDFACIAILAFDILYFSGMSGSFAQDMMFYCTIGLAIIYCFMRYYIYLMLITFDLSIPKLLKNALIFTTVGIWRNIAASVGVLLMIALNLLLAVWLVPLGVVVPLILPFFYLLPCSAFMTAYAAYPKIKQYMIDPQIKEEEEGGEDVGDEDGEEA